MWFHQPNHHHDCRTHQWSKDTLAIEAAVGASVVKKNAKQNHREVLYAQGLHKQPDALPALVVVLMNLLRIAR